MNAEQADQRIIQSRQNLHRYLTAAQAGQLPMGDAYLVAQEIAFLEGTAETFPDKALKIERLIEDWMALAHQMRAGMH